MQISAEAARISRLEAFGWLAIIHRRCRRRRSLSADRMFVGVDDNERGEHANGERLQLFFVALAASILLFDCFSRF